MDEIASRSSRVVLGYWRINSYPRFNPVNTQRWARSTLDVSPFETLFGRTHLSDILETKIKLSLNSILRILLNQINESS